MTSLYNNVLNMNCTDKNFRIVVETLHTYVDMHSNTYLIHDDVIYSDIIMIHMM